MVNKQFFMIFKNNNFYFFLLLFFSLQLKATDVSWTGGGGDNSWQTAGNWNPASVPGAGDSAIFGATTPAATAVSLGANVTIDSLQINSNNFATLFISSPNRITVDDIIYGAGISNNSTFNVSSTSLSMLNLRGVDLSATNSAGVTFFGSAAGSLTLNSPAEWVGPGNIALSGNIFAQADYQVTCSGNLDLTITPRVGPTSQLGSLVLEAGSSARLEGLINSTFSTNISGAGSIEALTTLTLTGTNAYQGGTTITAGTLTANTTSLPSTGGVALSAGTQLTFDQATTGSYTGVISGAGNLTKEGTGTLFLTGANTYSVGTEFLAGTLSVGTDANLGTGDLTFLGGALNTSATFSSSKAAALTGTGAIETDNATSLTLSGVVSGTGALTKLGTGTLILSGTNTYSGGTTFSAGTLGVDTDARLGTGDLAFNGGALNTTATFSTNKTAALTGSGTIETDNAVTLSLSGVVSGTGALTKSGTGTLLLSGTNTYSGGTTFSAGTLGIDADARLGTGGLTFNGGILNTTATLSSSKTAALSGAGTIDTGDATTLTLSGAVSGTGALTKLGTGILVLGGINTYSGNTTVSAGTLSVTGSISDSGLTTIAAGGVLMGNGTTGALTNSGNVSPGTSIGTLTISGDFIQEAAGNLNVEINPSSSDLLDISGTAALDGSVTVLPEAGVYVEGTGYTILNANGGITGTFSSLIESHPLDFSLVYNATNVRLMIAQTAVLTPVPITSLKGNDRRVGGYMYGDPSFVLSSADLTSVSNKMLALSPEAFRDALVRVSPLTTAGIPLISLQNNLQMAVVLDKQYQKEVKSNEESPNKKLETVCYGIPNTGLFVEPIGVFYNQKATGGSLTDAGQVAFQSYTYGAGVGWEQVLKDRFVLEGGVGYTHSNLNWKENFGNAKWDTIYVAPFFGWFNKKSFANFMVMGAFNFHETDRKISFTGLDRDAKSRYNSYDLLLRVNAGTRIFLGHNVERNFWFQPEGTLNYLTIFTDGYKEKGAGSINLEVKKRATYVMQPSFRGRLIKEFYTKTVCYAPNIYAGWLANILLNSDDFSARFVDAPNQTFFNIQGYTQTTNQLILGAEFYMQKFDKFELTSNFEADILSQFEIYTVKVKFEWLF